MRYSERNQIAGELLSMLERVPVRNRAAMTDKGEAAARQRRFSVEDTATAWADRVAETTETERLTAGTEQSAELADGPAAVSDMIVEKLLKTVQRERETTQLRALGERSEETRGARQRGISGGTETAARTVGTAEFGTEPGGLPEETAALEAIDGFFRRDSRRYDGGFDAV